MPKNKVLSFWVIVLAIILLPPIYNNCEGSISSPEYPSSIYSTYAGSPTTRYDTKYALIYLVISVLPYEYYYSLRLSLIPILPRLFHYISIMPTT